MDNLLFLLALKHSPWTCNGVLASVVCSLSDVADHRIETRPGDYAKCSESLGIRINWWTSGNAVTRRAFLRPLRNAPEALDGHKQSARTSHPTAAATGPGAAGMRLPSRSVAGRRAREVFHVYCIYVEDSVWSIEFLIFATPRIGQRHIRHKTKTEIGWLIIKKEKTPNRKQQLSIVYKILTGRLNDNSVLFDRIRQYRLPVNIRRMKRRSKCSLFVQRRSKYLLRIKYTIRLKKITYPYILCKI